MTDNDMKTVLELQRRSMLEEGFPGLEVRRDRLKRLENLIVNNRERMCEAVSEDFHNRPHHQTLGELAATVQSIRRSSKLLPRWMKPEKRDPGLLLKLTGARAEVQFQPLGVIGIISPWNFPFNLCFSPMTCAFGAGNRVMIKPSELSPASAELIRELVTENYDQTEAAVFTGGVEVGQDFSRLPFDHLVYTGGPGVARMVMREASEHLVPVTLELGGKCPVVVGKTADLKETAGRVMTMKTMNTGQICLSPDYLFVHKDQRDDMVRELKEVIQPWYESIADNPDFCSMINDRHHARVASYIEDARQKGATVEQINPANEEFHDPVRRKLPPTLVVEPNEDMKVLQEEIFGPILSIKTYENLDEVIGYVNSKPRPLALYYFGKDKSEADALCKRTTSGGVTINDIASHVSCDDLPLSGVGNSGMGAYHGIDGFRQFSHKKAVFRQGFLSLGKFLRPPYTDKQKSMLDKAF